MMKDVVIGWDFDQIEDQAESFKEGMRQVCVSASGSGDYETDDDHVSFVSDKARIDVLAGRGACDILICAETLGKENIGIGAAKQWRSACGVQKMILVLANSKIGKGKVKGLFDNGFYDILFEKDLTGRNIVSLILHGRSKDEAYDYYGLADYRDLLSEPEPELQQGKGRNDKGRKDNKKNADAVNKGKGRADAKAVPKKADMTADKPDKNRDNKAREKAPKKPSKPEEPIKDVLSGDVVLSSGKAIIKEQRAISRSAYSKSSAKEVDLSKSVTGFLKAGTDVKAYVRAMEAVTHAELPENNERLEGKDAALEELLLFYTTEDPSWMGNLERHLCSREQWDAELALKLTSMQGYDFTPEEQREVFNEFNEFMFGYDFLGDLIKDEMVTDIKCLSYDSVLVKRQGKRVPEEKSFRSPEHYRAFISHLAKRNHVNILNNAAVKFMDTRTFDEARLRVNIQTEYLNCSGMPSIHMRKENNVKYTTDQLVDAGMMTYDTAAYLIYKAREDTGIVFCGGNAQGKTSVFNWLLDFIPYDMTGQCIQESDELFSMHHKYIQFLQVTDDEEGNFENGQGVYDLKRLAAVGLKTDNDYFMIGEITGAEAKYFINYVYTGSRCWTTVHAMEAKAALPKIADYGMYETEYNKEQLLQMLVALKVIVFVDNFQIKEIKEVVGWDEDAREIIYKDIPIVVPKKPDPEDHEAA